MTKKGKHSLKIGWLYPDLMSTYGDRGNVMILRKRCEWREIMVEVTGITLGTDSTEIDSVDLLFMGGAQDRQQEIVKKDLIGGKEGFLRRAIEDGTPGLFVCGAYQFLGAYYIAADGTKIEGLGIYDLVTRTPGRLAKRLIGDIIIRPRIEGLEELFVVGFENHGGRTELGKGLAPFADVVHGYGNNGTDRTEGVVYKNTIGTYLHGPILSKNPELADYLIRRALEIKYGGAPVLEPIEASWEREARDTVIGRYIR
ncbi:MAG: cobalamin biosynthesis protein CobQ [Deltaproteobacteria bacterium]|nr:cobalamin biosynthesis protein CobQ [Candidatus Zymogenaceae bacterium]